MAFPGNRLLSDVDGLLRPHTPEAGAAPAGHELGRLIVLAITLGAIYGFFMGWYAVTLHWGSGRWDGFLQLAIGMLKLPALFLATLAVTFPSLYVFSALSGVELSLLAALRLLVSAIVVNLAVAASLGTILAFFTLSTTSYSFMVVLNVVLLTIAGLMGLAFLRRALAHDAPSLPSTAAAQTAPSEAGAPDPTPKPSESSPPARGRLIFRVWTIIYGLVGMQMGWLLRPFIGQPDTPFALFRARSGNFFVGLLDHLSRLLGS